MITPLTRGLAEARLVASLAHRYVCLAGTGFLKKCRISCQDLNREILSKNSDFQFLLNLATLIFNLGPVVVGRAREATVF